MTELIRVALVDDNPEYRSELASLFENHPEMTLVAACRDLTDAQAMLPETGAHVIFVDLNLPSHDGIRVVQALKGSMPSAKLLILTIEHDGRRLIEALAAGAVGYLVKTSPPERILDAVKEAMLGGSPISSNVARLLVERFQTTAEPSEALTEREKQILALFAAGRRAKEVGQVLGLSVHTIRAAVRIIYSKLQAHSVAEAVAKFQR